jgi:hypothetical protein
MGLDRLRAEHELLADAPRRRAPAQAHSTESTLRKKSRAALSAVPCAQGWNPRTASIAWTP